jgi:hypothetical protein
MVSVSQTRGGLRYGRRVVREDREEVKMMRTYYWKVFRHMLSTAVFAGFGNSLN